MSDYRSVDGGECEKRCVKPRGCFRRLRRSALVALRAILLAISSYSATTAVSRPGVAAALGAALLFGAGTPLAKALLTDVNPWLLAGLLYIGSGIGLTLVRALRRSPERARLAPGDWRWLTLAVPFGGIIGPVLLMPGLVGMPASGAALLLNAESVFAAVIAWVVFRENVDRRVFIGMLAIVAGAVSLSWPERADFGGMLPALAVLAACLCWGIDNNLTRKVSLADAGWIATVKGLGAGGTISCWLLHLALRGRRGTWLAARLPSAFSRTASAWCCS